MNRNWLLTTLIFCFLWASPVMAFELDFDQLFSSDLLEEVAEEDSPSLADAMLTSEGVELGGKYNFTVSSRWNLADDDVFNTFATNLNGNLFLDARPDPDFRVFTNIKVDYGNNIHISELFSDFNHKQQVFFRGGKQTINWGVGYFFSPADVINISKIDPENPEEQVEGPVALRINVPVDIHNYYLYLLFNDVAEFNQIGIAPKVEFVVDRSEIGFGGFYQKNRAPRLMTTFSSSIKGVSIFGEGMLSYGSDKKFIEYRNPIGLNVIEKDEELFFKGTVGFRFSRTDDHDLFNLAAAAQYYYNGEYYEEDAALSDLRMGLLLTPEITLPLLKTKGIALADLAESGRHYFGATASWNNLLDSDFTLGSFWLGNLSDKSGQLSVTLSTNKFSNITPSIGISKLYGEQGSEFNLLGSDVTTVFFNLSLGSGSF